MTHLISVNQIGEYIRHNSCDRRFFLTINEKAETAKLPFYAELQSTIEPILKIIGRKREHDWEHQLQTSGLVDLGIGLPRGSRNELKWSELAKVLATLPTGTKGYVREVMVNGRLGAFTVAGQIDFFLLLWTGEKFQIKLVECKASRRDQTYHRIQVAMYRVLLRQLLTANPLVMNGQEVTSDSIECIVVRLDPDTNNVQAILQIEPFDLTSEERDIERLLQVDGRLNRTLSLPLRDIGYKLEPKCDGCSFNVHCFTESARQRSVSLLGTDPVTTRMLNQAGFNTIDQIADRPSLLTPKVEALCRNPGFDDNLKQLETRAKSRRKTLPASLQSTGTEYEVEAIPHTGLGQLPLHKGANGRLVRVYLTIDYDYTENRIGAISAHVTKSEGRLHTKMFPVNGDWIADPQLYEQFSAEYDSYGSPRFRNNSEVHPAKLRTIVQFKSTPWKGEDYAADTLSEAELIQEFFKQLITAIREVAEQEMAPIHFYVWSHLEIEQLIEACCRADTKLLGHLQQLLGCRQGLEQLIYSSVQSEIDHRYALGWTSRGLSVVSSLKWYGRSYHWTRMLNGEIVALDKLFSQNIFDFTSRLDTDSGGNWVKTGEGMSHLYEIRSRFHDSLPPGYWYAVWGMLPDPEEETDQRIKNGIERYNQAGNPLLLEAYLGARCHALRWLEENVTPKNKDISKPAIQISELETFILGRNAVAQAASDFLKLDQQVKVTTWIGEHLLPPLIRVPRGRTLPLAGVSLHADQVTIQGRINLDGFLGLNLKELQTRCSFTAGSFVRLSPWSGDVEKAQTITDLTSFRGKTCVIESINWKDGLVILKSIYSEADEYTLPSGGNKQDNKLFTEKHATIDESVTDFVARRVDHQLDMPSPVYNWFDPVKPVTPKLTDVPSSKELEDLRKLLASFSLPPSGRLPDPDQVEAVLEGLCTRVQLLQGPPGTGKTTTTALSVLTRARRLAPGDIVFLSAHTHRAIDELLARLATYSAAFAEHVHQLNMRMTPLKLVKVHSSEPDAEDLIPGVENLSTAKLSTQKCIKDLKSKGILVIGGTTAGLLKLVDKFGKPKNYNNGAGLEAALLVVDEASMMVFPHFLALATTVTANGLFMLTGDHRQLAPIVAHDWDNEDRPPAVIYQPFVSAFVAIDRLTQAQSPNGSPLVPLEAIRRSALKRTFRLPPVVRDLISRVYRQDGIVLEGPNRMREALLGNPQSLWHEVWRWSIGLYLILHDEAGSKRSNQLELDIVNQLLLAAPDMPAASVAIITPHRAQRSLLTTRLARPFGPDQVVDTVDTVERLQGSERPNVIISATVSDPTAIEMNVEFILNLNRANVAFSRVQQRLIVICSKTLLNHIPAEIEPYQSALLWKTLRESCSVELGNTMINGHCVQLLTTADG
jgi:hypothetical protein